MKRLIAVISILTILISLLSVLNIVPVSASAGTESVSIVKDSVYRLNGDYFECRYTITNTGAHALKNVVVTDAWDQGDASPVVATIASVDNLAAGATVKFMAKHKLTQYESNLGSATSVASVTATGYLGEEISASDSQQIAGNSGSSGTTSTAGIIYSRPVEPVPELPAGILFGIGLAGLGTFAFIRARKAGTAKA